MRGKKGFTLVELIVVMAILAILASMVTLNVSAVVAKGRVTRIQTDLKMLEAAGNQFLYAEADRAQWTGQELTQEQLIAQKWQSKVLYPPLQGYAYHIRVRSDGLAQATMENEQGVYTYGDFTADTYSEQFN